MASKSKVGRNESCPCGSGKKHKHCCGQEGLGKAAPESKAAVFIGLILLIALGGLAYLSTRINVGSRSSDSVATNGGFTPAPPGPAPPGQVWSVEHGHYHNLAQQGASQLPASDALGLPAANGGFAPAPQPDGPVPPGKVWNVEHGHWHDAAPAGLPQLPATAAAPANGALTPGATPPPGPAPPGQVWSAEHGHYH